MTVEMKQSVYKEDHLSSMENRPEAEPIEQDEDVRRDRPAMP